MDGMRLCNVSQDDVSGIVAGIFDNRLPYLDYVLVKSKSIRNSLLAYYLIEHLPAETVMKCLKADQSEGGIRKLVIADEVDGYTGKTIIKTPLPDSLKQYRRRGWYDSEEGDKKEKIRIGACYPNSSLEKVVMVSGLKLYRAIYEHKSPNQPPEEQSPYCLRDHPAFQGVVDGADSLHAANCYLMLFYEEAPEFEVCTQRIENAASIADLKRLLGFTMFHDRTVTQELKNENIRYLNDLGIPTELVFLHAVVNWNKDLLLRMAYRD